jgi:hypothetical protein
MAIPSSPARPSGRKSARQLRRVGVLHHLAALLSLAGLGRRGVSSAEASASAPQRRRRQRLALVQRLLDPLPAALRPADTRAAELFWRALRWGGGGILLARWLGR